MANKRKHVQYEDINNQLLELVITIHERNKKRIKYGKIFILILPIIMILIRLLTDGDKIVFLIIWIVTMFLTAGYLIGIEYLDETIKKKLKELTNNEVELDNLLKSTELKQKLKGSHNNLNTTGGAK